MSRYYLSKLAAEHHTSSSDFACEFLFNAMNIGEAMVESGAEVSSVEESIRRICAAYGAERTDVFSTTSFILVTTYSPDFGTVTQSRRITSTRHDLYKLSLLKGLARKICREMPLLEEVEKELDDIMNKTPQYSFGVMLMTYALISSSFTLFFGGSFLDATASGLIGIFLKGMESYSRLFQLPPAVSAVFWSFVGGCLATFAVRQGLGDSVELISIGNIMLLIPGLLLTNSIRDMFSGDILTSLLNFCNAFLLAVLIALGFALATLLF